MQRIRKTRIVATIGPASRDPQILEKLILAGVDVFRVNLSHGTQEDHKIAIDAIRAAAKNLDRVVGILADLCGPKIRVGQFKDGSITLNAGESVTITTRDVVGEPGLIVSQYRELHRDLRVGDRILFDDGLLEAVVESTNGSDLKAKVIHGGLLKERKGINLPGARLSVGALTPKDRDDAKFAIALQVDYLALSFVRQAEDIESLRELIVEQGATTPIIAKIEKCEALEKIDAIVEAADGLMVARGDLGVEFPLEKVPIVQRDLVLRARAHSKPVIVATQMLESMIQHPRPTRAEVSDATTAVIMGTDAVMLSAETAVGLYPVEAVEMLDRIAIEAEAWQRLLPPITDPFLLHGAQQSVLRPAVARATMQLARDLSVGAIVVRSLGGRSAAVVSSTRPHMPILALTTSAETQRRLQLFRGVMPCLVSPEEFNQPRPVARNLARKLGLVQAGEYILLLAGFGREEPTLTALPV